MCSSECERVSICAQHLEADNPKRPSQMDERCSSNSNRRSSQFRPSRRPLLSIYLSLLCITLFLSLTLEVDGAAIVVKRRAISAEDTSTSSEKEPKECHNNTPCGWAVYKPSSRRMDYYIRNVCRCPAEKECLKSEDDLSVNAYVYRCKVRDSPPINKDND